MAVDTGCADEDGEGELPRDGPRGDHDRHREGEDHADVGEGAQHPRGDPEHSGGDAFITAEVLAGKKALAPTPLTTLASTTTQRPLPTESWA